MAEAEKAVAGVGAEKAAAGVGAERAEAVVGAERAAVSRKLLQAWPSSEPMRVSAWRGLG